MEKEISPENPGRKGAKSAASNAGWNAFSTFWSIVISFAIAPALIHNLGAADYGIYLLISSVTGLMGLMSFGFGEATLRYMAHYFGEDDLNGVNRTMGSTLTLYTIICAVICTGMFTLSPLVVSYLDIDPSQEHVVSILLKISALIFSVRVVSLTYGAVPMALHRYDISSKVAIVQNVVRSGGLIVLALAKFSLLSLLLWELISQVGVVLAQGIVIRRIARGVRLLPNFSFAGLKEIAGFSVFSFLTYGFHMAQRESAKIVLGTQIGAAPVAYLGTPDNVAQRLHMVVASGSETLMPRFSANRDPDTARQLFYSGTWIALTTSLILLLPLTVLLPDFLRLWISADFAKESALLGQLVVLSYITQGAYAPAATFFRGTGKPWMVTIFIFIAGVVTTVASILLVKKGVVGIGYAYLLGSIPALFGVIHCWYYMFGPRSNGQLFRLLGLPLLMGGIAYLVQHYIYLSFGALSWFSLFLLGGLFVSLTSVLVIGPDLLLGGQHAPSVQFLEKIVRSRKVAFLARKFKWLRIGTGVARSDSPTG